MSEIPERTTRVLVIEDNPGDARLVQEAFAQEEGSKFQLEFVDRVTKGLERLGREGIDIIVTDLSLPDSHGLETLLSLRAAAPAMPIVVLTGTFEEAVGSEALRKGADDYLLKERLDGHVLCRSIRYAMERKRVQQDLIKTSMALAHTQAELEQLELFAHVATHDLREPLHKISLFTDLLRSKTAARLGPEEQNYMECILSASKRMSEMMEELRELSRLGSPTKAFEAVDLKSVAEAALVDLKQRLTDAKGTVDIGEIPPVYADRLQMRQVFQNLIGNALKFRKKNVPPTVTIRGRAAEEGFVEVSVEDNGIGFDEKYLDRIFKPFQRLQKASEYEGSGIGLAICQKIVSRHGGTITAHSRLGGGATFVLTLPAARF